MSKSKTFCSAGSSASAPRVSSKSCGLILPITSISISTSSSASCHACYAMKFVLIFWTRIRTRWRWLWLLRGMKYRSCLAVEKYFLFLLYLFQSPGHLAYLGSLPHLQIVCLLWFLQLLHQGISGTSCKVWWSSVLCPCMAGAVIRGQTLTSYDYDSSTCSPSCCSPPGWQMALSSVFPFLFACCLFGIVFPHPVCNLICKFAVWPMLANIDAFWLFMCTWS